MSEEQYSEDEDVYGDSSREDLVENDELSPEEEAFMQGYDKAADEEKEEEEKKEAEE